MGTRSTSLGLEILRELTGGKHLAQCPQGAFSRKFIKTNFMRAAKKALWIKEPAAKLDDPSSIPKTNVAENSFSFKKKRRKRRTYLCELQDDFLSPNYKSDNHPLCACVYTQGPRSTFLGLPLRHHTI